MVMEKYFIGSNGEEPYKVHFSFVDATREEYEYIDIFDEEGEPVSSWKKKDKPPHTKHVDYTKKF
jgi:hypothetical protein